MTDVSTTLKQEQNKELVRRIPEEVLGEGNLDLLDELYGEDAVEHNAMGTHHGQTAIRASFEAFLTAFPDISQTVEDVVAEDDTVAIHITSQGTHEGELAGIKPTGN
ncbi:ester cyclase [Halostagnicola sp. A56]|uniref:ester cyclase n=1 Tax=Halostagnicola sp. A56 TaxID=1495067 RepID=UPI001E56DF9E|nr:ester cyclase [Halostagnicola sp. A56]